MRFACAWKLGSAIIFLRAAMFSGSFIIWATSPITDGSRIAFFKLAMPSCAGAHAVCTCEW